MSMTFGLTQSLPQWLPLQQLITPGKSYLLLFITLQW